ncbi:hypothetical protein [Nisaea sediminum]|uniref:hypothetical protein n=1 Tax=Nisaea sediminum TaxID=2775867 RepID=UPI0018683D49|nr:hypothetical protein [Nisaea sediminum]
MAVIAIALLLSGCLTAREPAPAQSIRVSDGNGAVSLNLCFFTDAPGTPFSVQVHRVSDDGSRIVRDLTVAPEIRTEFDSRNFEFYESGKPCRTWRFQAPPGRYAVGSVGWRSTVSYMYMSHGRVTKIQPPDRTNYITSLLRQREYIAKHTPIFEIRKGEVTRLGSMTFAQRTGRIERPVENNTGTNNDSSTDIFLTLRNVIEYRAPAPDLSANDPHITGNVTGANNQTLETLVGRDIKLGPGPVEL